jgi:hypothetical protein
LWLLTPLLHQVTAADPLSCATALGVLALVALAAGLMPARVPRAWIRSSPSAPGSVRRDHPQNAIDDADARRGAPVAIGVIGTICRSAGTPAP